MIVKPLSAEAKLVPISTVPVGGVFYLNGAKWKRINLRSPATKAYRHSEQVKALRACELYTQYFPGRELVCLEPPEQPSDLFGNLKAGDTFRLSPTSDVIYIKSVDIVPHSQPAWATHLGTGAMYVCENARQVFPCSVEAQEI